MAFGKSPPVDCSIMVIASAESADVQNGKKLMNHSVWVVVLTGCSLEKRF